jgi:hypothetical protein
LFGPGSNYRTRTDFSTVLIPEGSLVHYKLVLDRASGQFLGSGVVSKEEVGEPVETSAWNRRFTLGVGLPISSTSNVVGATNETSIGGDLTFDTYLTYSRDQNYANFIFEIEEGFIRIKPESTGALPVQKTRDRLRFDTLYTRFVNPRIGPYVRFGLLTSVFESRVLVTEDGLVILPPAGQFDQKPLLHRRRRGIEANNLCFVFTRGTRNACTRSLTRWRGAHPISSNPPSEFARPNA